MTTPTLGTLSTEPIDARPDLLAEPVRAALSSWEHAAAVGTTVGGPLRATDELPALSGVAAASATSAYTAAAA